MPRPIGRYVIRVHGAPEGRSMFAGLALQDGVSLRRFVGPRDTGYRSLRSRHGDRVEMVLAGGAERLPAPPRASYGYVEPSPVCRVEVQTDPVPEEEPRHDDQPTPDPPAVPPAPEPFALGSPEVEQVEREAEYGDAPARRRRRR